MANPALNRWEKVERLGEGGQGEVFLAISPTRVTAREKAKGQIPHLIRNLGGFEGESTESVIGKFLEAVREGSRAENPTEIGALKEFKIPSDDSQAVGRLMSEVQALKTISHPAVLRLLDSNIDERFIVTECHRHGSLSKNLHLYQRNALAALQAFRILVEGVSAIHKVGAIHRDIKPDNIFVAESGTLVLGDFGIVFFQDGERLTMTYERVGSHFWMAPWAYDNVRLEFAKINPTLDVYPLGKVLWSMISGRNGFPYWEYAEVPNNLEKLFPDDPNMPLVNELLAKFVVRHEKDCRLSSASDLLSEVDGLIEKLKARERYRPDGAPKWPCRICGRGNYQNRGSKVDVMRQGNPVEQLEAFVCDHCFHVELFGGGRT